MRVAKLCAAKILRSDRVRPLHRSEWHRLPAPAGGEREQGPSIRVKLADVREHKERSMRKLTAFAAATLLSAGFGAVAHAQALNNNPLSDVRVRQAIAYAIDKDTIVATILDGNAVAADGLLPNGPFKSPNLDKHAYDPDKARELLKEANWDPNRTLEMVYYYNDQQTTDLMTALQAELADVGIKMNFHLLTGDVSKTMASIPSDPKGKSIVSWDLGYGARAAMTMQEYFNDYGTNKASSDQYPGSPEMDALIAASNSTIDPEAQKKALMAIDEKINKEVITIPLYYQQLQVVESNRLSRNGQPYGNEQFNYNWGVQNWTIQPDADGKKVLYTNRGPVDNYFPVPWTDLGLWVSNKFVFDHLLYATGDLSDIAGGDLADKWTVSPDGKTVSFTLRDGISWQDGTPITVDDVQWSIEAALHYPTLHGVVRSTFNSIVGAADYLAGKAPHIAGIATDGKTITLTLSKVDPNVLKSFAQFAILPKAQFTGVDPALLQQAPYWQHPIGSGPFKVSDVKFGDYVALVPFDNYWGGKPKIDQIVAFASGDGDTNIVKNFTAHRQDFTITKATGDVAALKKLDFVKLTPLNIPYTRMIWINQFDK